MTDIRKEIDELVISAKKDVANAIAKSGKSKAVWVATSNDAITMLYEWSELTKAIKEQHGIDIPPLLDGVSISVS